LQGKQSTVFYIVLTLTGFVIGVPLILHGVYQHILHDFSFEYSRFIGSQANYAGSLFMVLGYIGGLILWQRSALFQGLKNLVASVGRMALSNYLLQTIVVTSLAYGHGLGLYGKLDRTEQLLLVIPVWGIHFVFSYVWMNYFRFGPLEWLWRIGASGRVIPLGKNH
jgi:uncharacterized protein